MIATVIVIVMAGLIAGAVLAAAVGRSFRKARSALDAALSEQPHEDAPSPGNGGLRSGEW